MTPDNCKQHDMVSRKVRLMRQGGQGDDQIYAKLMRDGWPTAAVVQALKADQISKPDANHPLHYTER